jgi:pimeloyl-ACP methyl ester carboxylesterase
VAETTTGAEAPAPTLPPGLKPGTLVTVPVPGDRPATVVHGAATTRRALVYLHGVCGNIEAIGSWAEPASRFGTVVALRGDRKCDVPGRYRWNQDTVLLDMRIDRALAAVAEARRGLLDTQGPALIGYSQGATRAMELARRFPDKYLLVALGGSPVAPGIDRLSGARAIAVFGGERESMEAMRRGFDELVAAGKRSRFFVLPGAGHGEYGPEGASVMSEVLEFLFEGPPEASAGR